jgi:alpha-N-arabinofuranosidase
VTFEGIAPGTKGKLTVLSAPGGLSSNTLNAEDGTGVAVEVTNKREQDLTAREGGMFAFELANYEVAVLTT